MNEESQSNTQHSNWFDKVRQIFFNDPKSREEILNQLREIELTEPLDSSVLKIIEGALQVSDLQVRDVMIPRSQMASLKISQTLEEILPIMIEATHSRFPVFSENRDDVLGILLAKDLLPLLLDDQRKGFNLKKLLRNATVIPESKRLNVLLNDFRSTRNHMAIVVDEYGSVAGLITIEDVLEQIVGDIEDEHDITEDAHIRKLKNNTYLVDALTPIIEFNEFFSSKLNEEEFDTIGGIVMQSFGHLPKIDEQVMLDEFKFKVISADNRRINQLEVIFPVSNTAARKSIEGNADITQDS